MQRCLKHKGRGMMNKKCKSKQMSVLKILIRIFPQVISVSPLLFIFNSILFAIEGALFTVSVWCMQMLFDKVANLAINKGMLKDTILALLLFFGVKVLEQIINGVDNFIGEAYDEKAYGKLSRKINIKISKLEPICFEDTEILDDINKSYSGIRHSVYFVNTIMDIITHYIPYFIFISMYMYTLKPVLTTSILLIFLPVLFAQLMRVRLSAKLEDTSAPYRRKNEYYEKCLTSRLYLKETRNLGASSYFMKLFEKTLAHMNLLKWKADIKVNTVELLAKILCLIGYIGILWMLFDGLIKKQISVGAFAAVFASIKNMFDMMEEVICGRLADCSESFGKIQNYLRFLDLAERIGGKISDERIIHGDIVLEDVSFAYPSSQKNAVQDVNLTIRKGETIAVVGENGSGKSTLVRLLTGIYLPKKGRVLHNNISTDVINSQNLFKGISGVFQKFQKYQLCLSDNIKISEMEGSQSDTANIENAVIQSGIVLNENAFPDGYKTMLSKEFGGVDLSGGQWQKIAIARGLYRKHEIIILDEPTAAIDPIEETKIYERFAEIAKDKTAVIVTHRLGSVKFANRIVVMKDGEIVGTGTHDELIESCPLYSYMWKSQAQYYVTS